MSHISRKVEGTFAREDHPAMLSRAMSIGVPSKRLKGPWYECPEQ